MGMVYKKFLNNVQLKQNIFKMLHVVLEVKYLKEYGKYKFLGSGVLTAVTMRNTVLRHGTL
jgi:hypothetical protein